MLKLIFLISVFLAGCTIPAKVFFRNFSNENVRLLATLNDRRYFSKLPNKVDFYEPAINTRQPLGKWRYSAFVTWQDTTTFYIDVPAFSVLDIEDVSRGLTLGARQPDVLLVMISQNKVDTLMTGDYLSLAKKFKSSGLGLFKPPVYYYDIH